MKCLECGVDLTQENTSPSVIKRSRGACRSCAAARGRRFRVLNPTSAIVNRARGNAKVRGIDFNLTAADIPAIPKFCPVFPWIKLLYQVGKGHNPGSPSLDRTDNRLGYVKGNVRIISDRANRLKFNATDEELIALGKDAESRNA
jgi:hypothetical protein